MQAGSHDNDGGLSSGPFQITSHGKTRILVEAGIVMVNGQLSYLALCDPLPVKLSEASGGHICLRYAIQ